MWWLFWFFHFIITAIFGLLALKANGRLGFCYFFIALFIPFSGFVFVLISIFYEMKKRESRLDFRGLMNNEKTDLNILSKANYDEKINTVPLEEAFIINKNSVKRRLMLEVLKSDAARYVKQLKIALSDNDTETSHYAASAMSEVKRKFENIIQELVVKYERNKTDRQLSEELVETISKYLKMNLLDSNTKIKYEYILVNAAESLIHQYEDTNVEVYKELLECLFDLKEYNRAQEAGQLFLQRHSHFEEPYVLLLKLYYMQQKRDAFLQIFEALRKSPVKLSNNGLNMVRFWLGGVGHASAEKSFD
jgi:hypothetical protein